MKQLFIIATVLLMCSCKSKPIVPQVLKDEHSIVDTFKKHKGARIESKRGFTDESKATPAKVKKIKPIKVKFIHSNQPQ